MAHLGLGAVYAIRNQWQNALDESEIILKIQPNCTDGLECLGVALFEVGQIEKSIKVLEREISIDSEKIDAHYHLGIAYRETKMYKKALEEFMYVLNHDANYSYVYVSLAVLWEQLGENDKALRILQVSSNMGHEHAKEMLKIIGS